MKSILDTLSSRLSTIRTSNVSVNILNSLDVKLADCYVKLYTICSTSKIGNRIIKLTPFSKMYMKAIENAISLSAFGVVPKSNVTDITVEFPIITTDRRNELIKIVKSYGEDAKVSVRQQRQKLNDLVKQSNYTDDEKIRERNKIQKEVDTTIDTIDNMVADKCNSLMDIG